ncbi:MAG: S-layer homology domain-containing protein, partial [Oscillospiraceae bacterium]|nr:S-layer homology domain-containing protein [Oscillospiraceae bacterium]
MKHTFKRVMALLLVVAMLLGVMPSVFGAQVGPFTDVQDDAWYAEFVKAVTEAGYMSGVRKDLFDPEGTCTRAMAATVLYRVEGEPPVGGPSTFKDLTADWYANAIAWAQDTGVVYGVTQTTFCPDKSVTREQLVTMIWRYMGEPEAKGTLDTFEDREYVAEYAREAFAWAIGEGIINGMPKGEGFILSPYTNATRAQFATIIVSAFKPHEHQWGQPVVTKEATCVAEGERSFTCAICGETKTEVIPATGEHNYVDGFCTMCGEEKEEESTVPPPPPGEYFAIYNVANGRVMTTEISSYTNSSGTSKDQIKSAAATLKDGKLTTTATNVATFRMETNEAGITTFVTADGKYLEADGTNLRFVDAPNANTEFILDEVEGGHYIRLANYKYQGTKDQYIEYYTSKEIFTCYGMGEDTTMYVFDFYEVEVEGGEEPTPPESSSSSSLPEPTTAPEGYVAIYNVAHGKVMTNEVSVYTSSSGSVKDQLKAAAATLEEGKLTTTATNVATFKMETNEAGITTFVTVDGKYLEADGTNLRFVDAPNANTEFILDEVEGGYYIRLANYKYQGTKDQYIEFYTSKDVFTCYGMGED